MDSRFEDLVVESTSRFILGLLVVCLAVAELFDECLAVFEVIKFFLGVQLGTGIDLCSLNFSN